MNEPTKTLLPFNGGYRKIYAEAAAKLGVKVQWIGGRQLKFLTPENKTIGIATIEGKSFSMEELLDTARKNTAVYLARKKQREEENARFAEERAKNPHRGYFPGRHQMLGTFGLLGAALAASAFDYQPRKR